MTFAEVQELASLVTFDTTHVSFDGYVVANFVDDEGNESQIVVYQNAVTGKLFWKLSGVSYFGYSC